MIFEARNCALCTQMLVPKARHTPSVLVRLSFAVPFLLAAVLAMSTPAHAQDTASGQIAQNRADGTAAANAEAVNNGTNPTLLTTQAVVQFQYNEIDTNLDSDLLEFQFTQPIGDGSKALKFTLPFANSPFDSTLDICRSTLIKEKLPLLAYFGDFCTSI